MVNIKPVNNAFEDMLEIVARDEHEARFEIRLEEHDRRILIKILNIDKDIRKKVEDLHGRVMVVAGDSMHYSLNQKALVHIKNGREELRNLVKNKIAEIKKLKIKHNELRAEIQADIAAAQRVISEVGTFLEIEFRQDLSKAA